MTTKRNGIKIGLAVCERGGRHVGDVIAIQSTMFVQVRWRETGWLSEHEPDELEPAGAEQ